MTGLFVLPEVETPTFDQVDAEWDRILAATEAPLFAAIHAGRRRPPVYVVPMGPGRWFDRRTGAITNQPPQGVA